MTTSAEIKEFITAKFLPDTDPAELTDDYDLVENGVIDSLGLLRVISWVAETYGLPLDDIAIAPENFRSIEAIRNFVDESRRTLPVA
ncbi:acyl carrier protein [Kitasatospora sp. GP82]|uniref:acyl carrier protein n=1 Tax=Kitasatospora sp. GP82 TaxID=3035089 RepID=UPI002474F3D1|nr:acyl carrier protein [Kitasatospora sp. GP82]MDH6128150.1 acyl carrier protein [Kitasatospora sp. GP82]